MSRSREKIARAVRNLSGGLRYVKAAGFLVEGQAQVSMNLTDYQKTPVHRVVEMIRSEAGRYGVSVTFSELIGLAPQEFFINAAQWYLQLDKFQPDQILEYRIQRAETSESVLAHEEPPVPEGASRPIVAIEAPPRNAAPFVSTVSEGTATPGGGAVAALAGALSAALAEMVARLTVGKKRYADVEETMNAIVTVAADLRARLLSAVEEDVAAFNGLMEAYRLPEDDPGRPRRSRKIRSARPTCRSTSPGWRWKRCSSRSRSPARATKTRRPMRRSRHWWDWPPSRVRR